MQNATYVFQQPQLQTSPTQQLVQVQAPMTPHQQTQIASPQTMQGKCSSSVENFVLNLACCCFPIQNSILNWSFFRFSDIQTSPQLHANRIQVQLQGQQPQIVRRSIDQGMYFYDDHYDSQKKN